MHDRLEKDKDKYARAILHELRASYFIQEREIGQGRGTSEETGKAGVIEREGRRRLSVQGIAPGLFDEKNGKEARTGT